MKKNLPTSHFSWKRVFVFVHIQCKHAHKLSGILQTIQKALVVISIELLCQLFSHRTTSSSSTRWLRLLSTWSTLNTKKYASACQNFPLSFSMLKTIYASAWNVKLLLRKKTPKSMNYSASKLIFKDIKILSFHILHSNMSVIFDGVFEEENNKCRKKSSVCHSPHLCFLTAVFWNNEISGMVYPERHKPEGMRMTGKVKQPREFLTFNDRIWAFYWPKPSHS